MIVLQEKIKYGITLHLIVYSLALIHSFNLIEEDFLYLSNILRSFVISLKILIAVT